MSMNPLLEVEEAVPAGRALARPPRARRRPHVFALKRGVDVALALALLPALGLTVMLVSVGNRFGNSGPLVFRQTRMGRYGAPFVILKFRTMLPAPAVRGCGERLEVHRITPFGRFLRRTHLDETPQILNVLKGDMSFVGPRPDVFEHAVHYCETVPLYRFRHAVRPGITGLAQVTAGYVECVEGTRRKAERDADYILAASLALDGRILLRTMGLVLRAMVGR
ncbi:sugar transferase [Acuticoccus mangrovi]|uniref:Sugar transferase n=1 Tax=Acuticoccus mangrovi TaxID=2796142 RepID=A0A934IFB6_9HYPH|nr:sugar transferase [Acuticoccus mangrovi]MBJ3775594.1 sugar transferase [Acuticoccus mangrovi]